MKATNHRHHRRHSVITLSTMYSEYDPSINYRIFYTGRPLAPLQSTMVLYRTVAGCFPPSSTLKGVQGLTSWCPR